MTTRGDCMRSLFFFLRSAKLGGDIRREVFDVGKLCEERGQSKARLTYLAL